MFEGVDLSKVLGGKSELKLEVRNLPDHLRRVFDEHEAWINTNAKQGERGVLIEEDLVGIRLSGRNLSGMILKGTKLTGVDLSKAILMLTDQRFSDLEGANLKEAMLLGTDLRGANLAKADLTGAIFKPIEVVGGDGKPTGRFQKPILDGANMLEAVLTDVDLSTCSTKGAKLS